MNEEPPGIGEECANAIKARFAGVWKTCHECGATFPAMEWVRNRLYCPSCDNYGEREQSTGT